MNLLEVLEHIPNTDGALSEVTRVARETLSVPSKEGNNPEHIHRLEAADRAERLRDHGFSRVKLDGVLNHLVLLARR